MAAEIRAQDAQYGEASFCMSMPASLLRLASIFGRGRRKTSHRGLPPPTPLPCTSRSSDNDAGSALPRKTMPKRKQTSSFPVGPRYDPSRLRQSSRASPAKASISSGRRPSNGLFSAAFSHSGFGGTWRKSAGRMPYRFSR